MTYTDTAAVRDLYTKRLGAYAAFVGLFRSREGLRALLAKDTEILRPRMRVLDAGCGFGLATFALLDAARQCNIEAPSVDAFDLTPAMLDRFRDKLAARPDARVALRQADVMASDGLPPSWTGYDLVLSTSMLEYLPRPALPRVLANLRTRLSDQGRILVMITRKSPEAKWLVERGWHAARYDRADLRAGFADAGFHDLRFVRFPLRYGWLNRANHVVVARPMPNA